MFPLSSTVTVTKSKLRGIGLRGELVREGCRFVGVRLTAGVGEGFAMISPPLPWGVATATALDRHRPDVNKSNTTSGKLRKIKVAVRILLSISRSRSLVDFIT